MMAYEDKVRYSSYCDALQELVNFPLSVYRCWPGAGYACSRPLPELDNNADVADDDGDEREDELGDVSEASVYEFVSLTPGFLTDHRVGGRIFKQLHDQSIAVNIL